MKINKSGIERAAEIILENFQNGRAFGSGFSKFLKKELGQGRLITMVLSHLLIFKKIPICRANMLGKPILVVSN